MSHSTRGMLYIATSEPYLGEAAQSARSVREHHPDMPITLAAPAGIDPPAVFDGVVSIDDPEHGFGASTLTPTPAHLPYDRTLFLDTDTYVTGSLDPVFELLESHDLAAVQDPTRTGTAGHSHDHDVPETFPQYNTGVLAYRECDAVRDLFARWNDLYRSVEGVKNDLNQPTFRMALYESNVRLATMPPEYNFRIGVYANSVLYACGPVRILHGRSMHWDRPDAAARINATDERRVVIAKPDPELVTNDERTPGEAVSQTVDHVGWEATRNGVEGLVKSIGQIAISKLP